MLLDTASLYYRAFYGVPDTMTAPDGTPVNAVRGLLDMIARLVRARPPRPAGRLHGRGLAAGLPGRRDPVVQGAPGQPDGTEQAPDALTAQVPVIEEVLAAMGVPMAGVPGYEADDVIGTLATGAAGPVEIVTGDRDLFQLVDDARPVRVIYTARGLAKLDVVDEAAVTGPLRDPRAGLRGLRRAARGSQRRTARSARGGGQDGGSADPLVRNDRGDHHRAGYGTRGLSQEQPGEARGRPGLPGRGAARGPGGHRRARAARRRAAAGRACRPGPAR